jgi:LmbE family N-acetylglucosaminyl deacetylase
MLDIHQTSLLRYPDGQLDRVDASDAIGRIAWRIRQARPQVVMTFAPDGAYGHPDHIAVSQLTTAAIVAAADPNFGTDRLRKLGPPHTASKLFYLAWNAQAWTAYQQAFKKLVVTVDGVERQATPWPDWALTTVVDTRPWASVVWRAVSCHESQVDTYAALKTLALAERERLWGSYSFYRAFSLVNVGRGRESDLFDGIPRPSLVHC